MIKLNEIKLNLNITNIIIAIIVILIIFGGLKFFNNKINDLKAKLETEVKLKIALLDSTKYYLNKQNELVAEKLSLQETEKNLKKINDQLNASQKELMARVATIEKNGSVIAAALIATNIKLDSLRQGKVSIDSLNKSLAFTDSTKNIRYNIIVGNAIRASKNILPTLTFKDFSLPNKQFVDFYWKDNKKAGNPVSFSITNTNPYFKTTNIDSYIIPAIQKDQLDPNGWQKIGKFFTKNGNTFLYVGIGAGAVIGYKLLSK